MSFNATVYRVLIASPSDVEEERVMIPEAIYKWNALNSEHEGIVLLPVKWETHSTPEFRGSNPQEILNRQFVRSSDLLIGAMWTKIGTPTLKHESGTVEEIEEFIGSGKPIMLYFSNKNLPSDVDVIELTRLREFKQKYQGQGIYKEYASTTELKSLIIEDLTRSVRKFKGESLSTLEVVPKLKKFDEGDQEERIRVLKEELLRYFKENERIFKEYGPFSLRANDPLSESSRIWKDKCVNVIIPNNEKIINLLQKNEDLIPRTKIEILDRFISHVEGLKQNHLSDFKDKEVPTFPKEIINILEP